MQENIVGDSAVERIERPYGRTEGVDQAKVWLCYASFCGDVEKASISSKTPLAVVRSLEHDFNWPDKLKRLRSGTGVSETEKTVNRAVKGAREPR